jgi:intracellular sulfur oxidation DsrE/DsrF family protein
MAAGPQLNRRRLLVLLGLLPALPLPAAAAPPERNKVVFHVNSSDPVKQQSVLRNLDNHIAAVGAENLDIKVLLQGGGVSLLLLPEALPHVRHMRHANADPALRRHIDALRAQGVEFLVSGRTLSEHGIDAGRDLYDVSPAQVVPNALSCLSELQHHGYAYIKP